jgi:DNA-binding NtrC family response regulator
MNADRKTKILVVEDDHLFLWSLAQFLKREGYDVRPATTAELAFDMAQKESFDIVISDFHLPGLNGKELIKKVKLLNPLTKTVLISAYQKEETGGDEESLLNAYLNKPIELRNLKRLLHDLTATPALTEARCR